jgi:uncharacterized protein (DUF433 family)
MTAHIRANQYGEPVIAGTRIRVHDVALWHKGGMTVEEMVEQFSLTPGQAHAALSYYYDHREEIEQIIQDEMASAERDLAEGRAIDSSELRARLS